MTIGKEAREISLKSFLNWILTILFFVSVLLCRPFRLGVDHTLIGSLLMAATGAASLALSGYNRKLLTNGVILASAVVAFWLFLAFQAALLGSAGMVTTFNAFLVNSVSAAGCALFFSSARRSEAFFRVLLAFFQLSVVSILVTCALHFVGGIPWREMKIGTIAVEEAFYSQQGDVLFPFSVIYNYAWYAGVEQPRFPFMVRESGIAQAIIGWLAVASLFYYRGRVPILVLGSLGIALVATLSTAMILTGIIVLASYVLFGRLKLWAKTGLSIGLSLAALFSASVWLNDETFGVAAKVNTASFIDRATAVQLSLERFYENPAGTGLYNSQGTNAAITFLAQLQEIGIMGAALAGLLLLFAHFVRKRVGGTMIPYISIVATALTTQPLIDVPGFLPLLFVLLVPSQVEAVTGQSFGPPVERKRKTRGSHTSMTPLIKPGR